MAIYAIRLWIHQTAKRLGPRLTSVVPGPGWSLRSTGWRWRRHLSPRCIRPCHSSSPCKSRRYTDHNRLSPYYSPPGYYSGCLPRLRYPSWESSSYICHIPRCTPSNTCPCRLPEYSFYSHPQCHCMSNISKLSLIKKKRNKKTSSKHVVTNVCYNLDFFINILFFLTVYRPTGARFSKLPVINGPMKAFFSIPDVIYQTHSRQCFIGISKYREDSWKYGAREAEYFWWNSRCLDSRWNTVSSVWYIFSIEKKTKE